ncbi:MAG: hypothetical protein RL685_1241 [Pseudomonadota bacterium]|jgi:hypothetical protein
MHNPISYARYLPTTPGAYRVHQLDTPTVGEARS